MIETFFGTDTLSTGSALLAALVVGFLFGFALERAGFSSSRKLAGIFYFRDMTVLKVMFSGLITAMLGLSYFIALGWIRPESVFEMETVYGAQIVGGLLFGVGFVVGGWCPGTAAAGLGAGKIDALLFLVGAMGGSILFNELFNVVKPLYTLGASGVLHIYDTLGLSKPVFALAFTLIAVGCFWGAEYIERLAGSKRNLWNSPFLRAFSVLLVTAALGLMVLSFGAAGSAPVNASALPAGQERGLLERIEQGADHIAPEDLAKRLLAGDPGLLVIDVRTPGEYEAFHIRGAINAALADLPAVLQANPDKSMVVLYSNGMTHPAQARDALERLGYAHVYLLTDGLKGFFERCLKPVSLRGEPVAAETAARIQAWRAYFAGAAQVAGPGVPAAAAEIAPAADKGVTVPGVVDTAWLADHLTDAGIVVLDPRPQPEYNTSHIPGSFSLNVESLRGNVGGVPSMLLPADMLARQFSLLGLQPGDLVVLAYSDKVHDATLIAAALERVGHTRYVVLNGGIPKWKAENRPMDAALPSRPPGAITPKPGADTFTVDAAAVLRHQQAGTATILDVRPPEYFTGAKSDEARPGHIPGAINRPFSEDTVKTDSVVELKPTAELEAAYKTLFPSKDAPIIVHCRTGHQASQTLFVLRRLLGYTNVQYYDAGWTEWAARPDLPAEK